MSQPLRKHPFTLFFAVFAIAFATSAFEFLVVDADVEPPTVVALAGEATPVCKRTGGGLLFAVDGGEDAGIYEAYLKQFNDPGMLKMAHISYGFNPGAQLTGNIVEDERVWGATEWGIGSVSDVDAPPCGQDAVSHTDGICLRSTIWLDERCILREGAVIDPELEALSPKK